MTGYIARLVYTAHLLIRSVVINSHSKSNKPNDSGAFRVFSIKQFRWLFFGNASFFLAMQGQMLTRTLLAWDLTESATSLAYINLVVAVPMIFASMIGGAITDRVERRKLILVGQGLIACNEIFILILLSLGYLEFWHMLCTAFIAGCAFPFIMPARMALTATVVGPDKLQSAMAYSSGVMNLSRVFGPAMMGVVVANFSVTAAYIISVSLYATAILCMFGVSRSKIPRKESDKEKKLWTDVMDGFSYVLNNRAVLMCLLFGLAPMLLAMPFQSLLVVLVDQTWQTGESGVGTLMAVGGIGGVLGSVWIIRRGDSSERRSLMLGSTAAFGVFLAIFIGTSNFYVALVPLLLANICVSASQTINNAAIQLLVDDDVRGRMSSFMLMSFALTPIGVFPMALAADSHGAANAMLGACGLLIAVVFAFVLFSKTIRNLDYTIKQKLAGAHEIKSLAS
ncbi:MFS transporter [Gammaproteobacteria bacterium]|nr:MFS transporter [Gammaproteobacteria bacterium]